MRRKAFTLIELLVVISIIALLMAILMPALGRARDQAKKITCSSNLRTLSQAALMYVNDNKGLVPCSTASWWSPSANKYLAGWVGYTCVDGYGNPLEMEYQIHGRDTDEYTGLERSQLWPYVQSIKCWRCPCDLDKDQLRSYAMSGQYFGAQNWDGSKFNMSYINYDQSGTPLCVKRMATQSNPSKRFLFIDLLGRNADGYFALWNSRPAWWNIPNYRHSEGTVNGFADGHVEAYKYDKATVEMADLSYEEAITSSYSGNKMLPEGQVIASDDSRYEDLIFFQRAVWGTSLAFEPEI